MLVGASPTIDTIIGAPYGDLDRWLYEMLGGTKTLDDVAGRDGRDVRVHDRQLIPRAGRAPRRDRRRAG
jgi:hypothetical protein